MEQPLLHKFYLNENPDQNENETSQPIEFNVEESGMSNRVKEISKRGD